VFSNSVPVQSCLKNWQKIHCLVKLSVIKKSISFPDYKMRFSRMLFNRLAKQKIKKVME